MQLFGGDLLFLRLAVPISPRRCTEPPRQFVLVCFRGEELILSCKNSHVRKKRTLYGCLGDVASVLEVCFRELIHHAPRVPGCGNACFPLRGEGHVPSQTAQKPLLRL